MRYLGPIRFVLEGNKDKANLLTAVARTQMGIMLKRMSLQGLNQLRMRRNYEGYNATIETLAIPPNIRIATINVSPLEGFVFVPVGDHGFYLNYPSPTQHRLLEFQAPTNSINIGSWKVFTEADSFGPDYGPTIDTSIYTDWAGEQSAVTADDSKVYFSTREYSNKPLGSGTVLGVSINQSTLFLITHGGGLIKVWARAKTTTGYEGNGDLYDEMTAPEGWQNIGSYTDTRNYFDEKNNMSVNYLGNSFVTSKHGSLTIYPDVVDILLVLDIQVTPTVATFTYEEVASRSPLAEEIVTSATETFECSSSYLVNADVEYRSPQPVFEDGEGNCVNHQFFYFSDWRKDRTSSVVGVQNRQDTIKIGAFYKGNAREWVEFRTDVQLNSLETRVYEAVEGPEVVNFSVGCETGGQQIVTGIDVHAQEVWEYDTSIKMKNYLLVESNEFLLVDIDIGHKFKYTEETTTDSDLDGDTTTTEAYDYYTDDKYVTASFSMNLSQGLFVTQREDVKNCTITREYTTSDGGDLLQEYAVTLGTRTPCPPYDIDFPIWQSAFAWCNTVEDFATAAGGNCSLTATEDKYLSRTNSFFPPNFPGIFNSGLSHSAILLKGIRGSVLYTNRYNDNNPTVNYYYGLVSPAEVTYGTYAIINANVSENIAIF